MSACITLFNSIVATYRNKNVTHRVKTLLMSKNIKYIEVYKMYHSNIPIQHIRFNDYGKTLES